MQQTGKRQKYLELKAAWIQHFGTSPPKNLSQRLLSHALAYQDQAARHNGLRAMLKKQLLEIAAAGASAQLYTPLATGARLVREWNGNTYVIDVAEEGFRMGTRQFGSLRAVAKAITGAHWSGRAFFGLTRRNRQATA